MKQFNSIFLVLFFNLPQTFASPSSERVLFQTNYGDMIFELYPQAAPKTVIQFKKLVQLGAYDATYFYRLEPGFVLQLVNVQSRLLPLSDNQLKAIVNLPLEVSAIPHKKGVLSMARWEDKPNSAETSFSILLGDAPHLDNKYTIFGRVERGIEVVDFISTLPLKKGTKEPEKQIVVMKAEMIESALAKTYALRGPPSVLAIQEENNKRQLFVTVFLSVICVLAFGMAFFKKPRNLRAGLFLTGLLSCMGAFSQGVSWGAKGWAGLGIFMGLLLIIRVMSLFEKKEH